MAYKPNQPKRTGRIYLGVQILKNALMLPRLIYTLLIPPMSTCTCARWRAPFTSGIISSQALVKYCPVYLPWSWDTLVIPAFRSLKVWEWCSSGKVIFFLKIKGLSLIFCIQGSLRRRHLICLLFFATKTYRYFHHSGLLIWSVECILVFESLILPLSFFWNAECLSEYCHFLVLSLICSNWPSF